MEQIIAKKQALIGKEYHDLVNTMVELGEKPFRAKQLWHYIYEKGIANFDDMTSLSKSFRELLKEKFHLNRLNIVNRQDASDGTIKFLFQLSDGKEIETVYIPNAERGTLCISSQVGCNMGCTFCHTGTQPMVRNLTSEEIILQVMSVKDIYNDYTREEEKRVVGNIVYMGMGEPLQNYKEVLKSLYLLNHNEGLAISKRKITISTCGIIPKIEQLAKDMAVNLSISLHSPTNEKRLEIMPINANYNIEELLKVLKVYYDSSNAKKVTLVYVMLKDFNDSDEDAHKLAHLAKGLPVKFNLIPFHPWDGCAFESSSNNRIKAFADILCSYGFTSPIRTTRGDDIMAACGQLKSESKKLLKNNYVN